MTTITKIFEVDSYYNSIEDQIKPIIEPPRILVPNFKTAKYEKIKEDGRSFGYPGDYGTFVRIEFEEFMGVLADDCIAFFDLNAQKAKQAKALDFDFDDYFDIGEEVEAPQKGTFNVVVDTRNDWMCLTDDGEVLYRTVSMYSESPVFSKIERDEEEYINDQAVLDDILSAQRFRNGIIKEANAAVKSALEITKTMQESL